MAKNNNCDSSIDEIATENKSNIAIKQDKLDKLNNKKEIKLAKIEKSMQTKETKKINLLKRKADLLAKKSANKQRVKSAEQLLKEQIAEIAQKQIFPPSRWYKLDNAGLIFPAANLLGVSNMFRLSALLKNEIDPLILQQAINNTVERFPSMVSAIRRGFFWYYLEAPSTPITAQLVKDYPCKNASLDSRQSQLRVTYFHKEISVEVFHSATDGTGGLTFLNTLIANYLQLQGVSITWQGDVLNTKDVPNKNELQDSFHQNADRKKRKRFRAPKAYKHIGTACDDNNSVVYVKGICQASQLNAIAKKNGATITQFIVACYIKSFQMQSAWLKANRKKAVVVNVPINLRKMYPSETLRNFSLIMSIICHSDLSFEDTLTNVKQMFTEQYTNEFVQAFMNANVGIQLNPFLQATPLPIKNIAMAIGYAIISSSSSTSSFSNLGINQTPPEFAEYVHRYEFTFGKQQTNECMLSAITFNDIATITFTKSIIETDMEQTFFSMLSSLGVELVIETNLSDTNRKEGV